MRCCSCESIVGIRSFVDRRLPCQSFQLVDVHRCTGRPVLLRCSSSGCFHLSISSLAYVPTSLSVGQYFSTRLQLHVFVDASECAYLAVAYLWTSIAGELPECALVYTKTMVAPLRKQSILRFQLQAAVLGARLSQFMKKSILYTSQSMRDVAMAHRMR